MADVIEASGLSAGAVYGYFTSKDDLILALADTAISQIEPAFAALVEQDPLPDVAEVIGLLTGGIELVGGHQPDLTKVAVSAWAEAVRNPAVGALSERFLRIREHLVAYLRRLQDAGRLDPEADPVVGGAGDLRHHPRLRAAAAGHRRRVVSVLQRRLRRPRRPSAGGHRLLAAAAMGSQVSPRVDVAHVLASVLYLSPAQVADQVAHRGMPLPRRSAARQPRPGRLERDASIDREEPLALAFVVDVAQRVGGSGCLPVGVTVAIDQRPTQGGQCGSRSWLVDGRDRDPGRFVPARTRRGGGRHTGERVQTGTDPGGRTTTGGVLHHARDALRHRGVTDDHDPAAQVNRQDPVEQRAARDHERGLVLPTQPLGAPPGEHDQVDGRQLWTLVGHQ